MSSFSFPTKYQASQLFNIDCDWEVPGFDQISEHVPAIDPNYHFNPEITRAILAGFTHNRRVLVQGLHGTGKSTHIEQIAARLNWPLVRINLDGHISRLELVGRDAIELDGEHQITTFQEGVIPWALQRPIALVFDEYDAGRPDVMFVIQRLLERDGRFALLDSNRVIDPHPAFRIFGTANTVGLGNLSGLYHGAQRLNQAQLDRWSIVATLDYLPVADEVQIVCAQVAGAQKTHVAAMVEFAGLTRQGFRNGDLTTLMSPRTVIAWADNEQIFGDRAEALRLAWLNRADPEEWPIISEYYQRIFDEEL